MNCSSTRTKALKVCPAAAALLLVMALTGNPAQAANNLSNHGGATMQNQVKGFLIYWLPANTVVLDTSQTDGTGNFETLTQRFFSDLSATSYFNINTQYPGSCGNNECVVANGTGAVALGGHWVDTQAYPNGKGTSTNPLQDSDICAEVQRAITQNHWTVDQNSEFFVVTGVFKSSGSGVVECNGGGCTVPGGFCAYHGNFGFNGNNVLYSYLSDANFNTAGCGEGLGAAPNGQADSDREVAMMSHEFFETVTDAGNAWWDSGTGNEIGDNCNQIGALVNMNGNPYWVQQQWSNASSSCVSAFGSSIQFVIGTGGDDLRGDSSATAALEGTNGAAFETVTLKPQNASGWDNNTGRIAVGSFNQASQTALGQVAITLTSHNDFLESDDNWNIQNMTVSVLNSSGGVLCRQGLSGNPLARLTAQAPTGTFPIPNCGPPPPPASVTTARITVATGNDDARSDTELWATINGEPPFCLKPSNNADADGVCNNGGSAGDQNGKQSWNNWTSSAQTFTLATPQPLSAIASLTIQLIEHNSGFETDDNWDIQGITVSLTSSSGTTTPLNLSNPNNGNNCVARLKGSPNSTSVAFALNGTNSHVYVGGKANGQATTCSNNGG